MQGKVSPVLGARCWPEGGELAESPGARQALEPARESVGHLEPRANLAGGARRASPTAPLLRAQPAHRSQAREQARAERKCGAPTATWCAAWMTGSCRPSSSAACSTGPTWQFPSRVGRVVRSAPELPSPALTLKWRCGWVAGAGPVGSAFGRWALESRGRSGVRSLASGGARAGVLRRGASPLFLSRASSVRTSPPGRAGQSSRRAVAFLE